MIRLMTILILVLGGVSFISSCSKPSDEKAYKEIVATMSMEKANRFFENYPHSQYRNKLVDEIIGWCKHEGTEECYKMILDILPKDHPRYEETAAYYKEHFGHKK